MFLTAKSTSVIVHAHIAQESDKSWSNLNVAYCLDRNLNTCNSCKSSSTLNKSECKSCVIFKTPKNNVLD